jgi:putative sigma-54 modulation protein
MDITVKTRNLEINDSLRAYVENKVNRLDRYLPNIDHALVELTVQNTKSTQDRYVAQVTLHSASGFVLRAEERSADMYSSIDAALDKVSRQIGRYKGKHWQSFVRRAEAAAGEVEPEVESEGEPEIETSAGPAVVRTKTFATRPMAVEDAIEQMELLGHDFFVFYSATHNAFAVVYRRRDAGYGLLLPELA